MVIECDDCNALFEGIPKGCLPNVGGIKRFAITERCNVSSLNLSSPGDEITAINMVGSALFYEFYFDKNTSTWTEKWDPETDLHTQEPKLVLKRREKSKRDTLALIGMKKDLVALVWDGNDEIWYLGETNGINMSVKDFDAGVAKKDINRYDISFMGEEPEAANKVTQAAYEAVI